jgi:hypothetical protein
MLRTTSISGSTPIGTAHFETSTSLEKDDEPEFHRAANSFSLYHAAVQVFSSQPQLSLISPVSTEGSTSYSLSFQWLCYTGKDALTRGVKAFEENHFRPRYALANLGTPVQGFGTSDPTQAKIRLEWGIQPSWLRRKCKKLVCVRPDSLALIQSKKPLWSLYLPCT